MALQRFHIVGVGQPEQGAPQQFGLTKPGQIGVAGVDQREHAVLIHLGDARRGLTDDGPQVRLGLVQRHGGFGFADVYKRQHHPIHHPVQGAVRGEPRHIRVAAHASSNGGADLAGERLAGAEHLGRVVQQCVVVQGVAQVGQRPAHVGFNKLEHVQRPGGEPFDSELSVQKDDAQVGGGHQVFQVVVDRHRFVHLFFEFPVDGAEFLVERLRLFFAGLEFFTGRAQLLYQRLQFLVGNFEFLVRGFKLLFEYVQLVPGVLAFGLEPLHHTLDGPVRPQRFGHRLNLYRPTA